MKPKKNAKICLVGGCGSSGTTLITSRISLHPEVLSGGELNFFNHRSIYSIESLRSNLLNLLSGKAPTFGYFDVERFLTNSEDFSIDERNLRELLLSSSNANDLFDAILSSGLSRSFTSQVVEKTPTNCYAFDLAVDIDRVNCVILVIRDPRDVCASLKKRGFNVFSGASRWLFDTLIGLRSRNHDKLRIVRFEQFCFDPFISANSIFSHLGLEALSSSKMADLLEAANMSAWVNDPERAHWRFSPAEEVATGAIGGWTRMLSTNEISAVASTRLTRATQVEYQLPDISVQDLAISMGYMEWPETTATFQDTRFFDKLVIDDLNRRTERAQSLARGFVPRNFTEITTTTTRS